VGGGSSRGIAPTTADSQPMDWVPGKCRKSLAGDFAPNYRKALAGQPPA
jgi:hypothetical protein